MIDDPVGRGRSLARLYQELAPQLFDDLVESGVLPSDHRQGCREWECFAMYACVRGLVAAGGFNIETGQAIDAFHDAVLDGWVPIAGETLEERRKLIAERYTEYGEIGQAGGASGAATVAARLGAAAAKHVAAPDAPTDALAETIGELHESLVEGASEAVRDGA